MLSIIVPVYDEQDSLETLHRQIVEAGAQLGEPIEIIFVDDGSKDGSWKVIGALAARDPAVSGVRFRRNFGKAAALTGGLRTAKGDLILTIDADLQDDPAEIPRMIARLREGFDVVNGWKQRRLDPWHKVYPSLVFNALVSTITGLKLHDHNCGLKMFRSEVAGEIRLYGELHRFIPVLAHARGFRVTELPVNHRPRRFGHSKYGVRRFARGFLDLLTVKFLTGFGERPQHILGGFGLLFFAIGFLGLSFLGAVWCGTHIFGADFGPIGTRPMLAYSIAATLLGAQALSLGLIAELLVAYTGKEAETFSVRERVGKDVPETAREPASSEKRAIGLGFAPLPQPSSPLATAAEPKGEEPAHGH
jgi:glycosyltransferase involved in cell wall biosynthesis